MDLRKSQIEHEKAVLRKQITEIDNQLYPYGTYFYRITNNTAKLLLLEYKYVFCGASKIFLEPCQSCRISVLRENGYAPVIIKIDKDDELHKTDLSIYGEYNCVVIDAKIDECSVQDLQYTFSFDKQLDKFSRKAMSTDACCVIL